jgi:hypothetical protein
MFGAASSAQDKKICILLHIITMTKQQTIGSFGSVPAESAGAGAPDQIDTVIVSREMRDAGERALDEFSDSYPPSLLVEAIYKAMRVLEPSV